MRSQTFDLHSMMFFPSDINMILTKEKR